MKKNNRMLIYPREAAPLLGKTERQCYRVFEDIRAAYALPPRTAIPIKLFANYFYLDEQQVRDSLM
ncbi:hypothetical protein [Sphingobacterium thalpophilum]|nr:hypothetical protein [Sphingobacterium thalpophilum]